VEGSLPKGAKGGVALAEISKEDGRIIRVSHGK
jgi:NTF2 fold immunity protein